MGERFYVSSDNSSFEKAFDGAYTDKEETDFRGRGQRFYRINGTLITITSPGGHRGDIQSEKVLVEIENEENTSELIGMIQNSTGFKLENTENGN